MRLIARFAQEKEKFFEVITVYDERTIKERLNKETPTLISIAKDYPAAVWFERKIRDDFGIELLYANDERPLIHHEHFPANIFPMRKAFIDKSLSYEVTNELLDKSKYGTILGPVHPLHLEASQFQLFDQKEKILHFELMSFYKYRGIEKMLEGLSLEEAKPIVERIVGSNSIAFQIALLDIGVQASKKTLPEMSQKRHTFLLELERIINHLTDLSVLCQLLDFEDGFRFFIHFVEKARVLMKEITGHRFGFGSINLNSDLVNSDEVYAFLFLLEKELIKFEEWIEKRDDILASTLRVGQISKEKVLAYGLVGIMARSVDIRLDRRNHNGFFEKHDFYINLEEAGDTFSRFNIRITEIFTSLRMIRSLADNSKILSFSLGTAMDGEYYSYVESSAGELMMYVALRDGLIERFFVRDPSFLNAQALPSFVKNTHTSTLGLIIKSIPLNISAIDL